MQQPDTVPWSTIVPSVPIADYSNQYGPLAFGLVSLIILLWIVHLLVLKPANEQRELDRLERGKDLEKITSIANAQTTMGENLRATADANAKATEDLKVIAKVHEAGMQQAERMTARLDRLAEKGTL